MINEHQKQTAFLRRCLLYEDTDASRKLANKMTQIQHDERSVRRAAWLVAVLAALATAGIGYSAVLMENYPNGTSGSVPPLIVKGCFGLGLGSLICLLSFLGLAIAYRRNLDDQREECRALVTRLLESRLGQPVTAAGRNGDVGCANVRIDPIAVLVDGSPAKPDRAAQL
jgi:hypothetical protein